MAPCLCLPSILGWVSGRGGSAGGQQTCPRLSREPPSGARWRLWPQPPRTGGSRRHAGGRRLAASELAAPPPSHPLGLLLRPPWRLERPLSSSARPGEGGSSFRLFFEYKPPSLIQQCLWGSGCVPGCAPLKPRSCRGRQGPCPLGPHASWERQRNGTRPGSAQWRVGAGQRDGGWPVASLGG